MTPAYNESMQIVRHRSDALSRWFFALVLAVTGGDVHGQDGDVSGSPIWQKVHADVFAGAPIDVGDDVVSLEAPVRAQDAAIVPIAIHASFPQTSDHYITKMWLIIDNNPSPMAAVFEFSKESGRADIETRVRVEQYTNVRAVALTNDGELHMAVRYVKASGGCSAPASKDAEAARASIGKMRLRVEPSPSHGQPALAQLMINHPNDSGLAMDQLTRYYAPAHFVRTVDVRYGGKPLLHADVDFSISENPNFRFNFTPGQGDELEARVVDNQDLEFATRIKLGADALRPASASR